MTVEALINSIKDVAGSTGLTREVEFNAMFEVSLVSSEEDETKQITLQFKDCIVHTDHPSKLKITLV